MRCNLPENFSRRWDRGDYAIAVIKEGECKYIRSMEGLELDCASTSNDIILTSYKKEGAEVYIVQFLSCDVFSYSTPMFLGKRT
jgi:hypothetical protein